MTLAKLALWSARAATWLPPLHPTDYVDLYERLQSGSRWNIDFVLMLSLVARTEPNILDMLIAVFSGMAAAYALARPSLAGTIAGVAIATALVPPTCATGICLAYGQFTSAIGAALLLIANVLAIILAAAITFRMMGLNATRRQEKHRRWVSRAIAGLSICLIAVSIPLIAMFTEQVHTPMALTVTNDTRARLLKHVMDDPDVRILLIGRPGIPCEIDPVDVGIIISSEHPLPRSYGEELAAIVRDEMQNPNLVVRVECVANNWAEPVFPQQGRTPQ